MPVPNAKALDAAIEARVVGMEVRMAKAYRAAIATLQKHMTNAQTIRRIASGEPLDIIMSSRILEGAYGPLRAEMGNAVQAAFNHSVPELPVSQLLAKEMVHFNSLSAHVRRAMDKLDAEILKPLKAEAREVVRQALAAGLESGKHPVAVARELRDVIGLAKNQEQYARNFAKYLKRGDFARALQMDWRDKRFDPTLKRYLKDGGKLTTDQLSSMVTAYRRKAVASHAVTITRTATLNAYRQGQRASVEEAISMGLMSRAETEKVWVTVGDSKVRKEHRAINGERKGIDETFSNGLDMPSEYRCRCKVRYVLRSRRRK